MAKKKVFKITKIIYCCEDIFIIIGQVLSYYYQSSIRYFDLTKSNFRYKICTKKYTQLGLKFGSSI